MKQGTGSYNGWKNYETWNVMLWLNNDEPLYRAMVAWTKENPKGSYSAMIADMGRALNKTPDGVRWLDSSLDYSRLDEAIHENE